MSEVRARWVEFKQLLRALATADDESVRLQMVVDSAPPSFLGGTTRA